MGNGYTRNDTANNIADGNVINASDLDGEFDKLQTAFDGSSGHSHDGTTGEGPQIDTAGIANDAVTLGTKTSGNYVAAGATSGTGISGSVSSEGGTFTVTSHATNANTASTIVSRDASGNFSAGTITASLTGTASNAALLDSLDSTQFLRSDAADTKTSGHLSFSDNVRVQFGASQDLQIYHDSATGKSYIHEQGPSALVIQGTNIEFDATDGTSLAEFNDAGAVSLRYSGDLKFATKSDGVLISGELEATTLDINGNADISGQLTMHNNVSLQDNDILQLGSSQDLQIYHDGTNSFIKDNGTGGIFMRATSNIKMESTDGNRVLAEFVDSAGVNLYYNNSNKLQTKSDGVNISGELEATSLDINGTANIASTLTMSGGNIDFIDGVEARFGNGADLRIYHDGSNSYIDDAGQGNLRIRGNDGVYIQKYTGEPMIYAVADGEVILYHDNSAKLNTTSTGININGNINAVDDITIAGSVYHEGDTDSYFGFHATNQWRVVTGGTEMLEVNDSYINLGANSKGNVQTTSVSSAITPNMHVYNSFVLTLTGNITLGSPTTEVAGMSGVFVFIHSGAGRTVSVGAQYETVGGAGLTLSGTSGAVDIVPYFVQSSGNILLGTPQLAFS